MIELKVEEVTQKVDVKAKEMILPDVNIDVSVDGSSGTPAVEVTKGGTSAAPLFTIAFSGLKGTPGERGADGQPGKDGKDGAAGSPGQTGPAGDPGITPVITVNASVDAESGTPTVTVTKTGTDEAPIFTLAFSGLKGQQGEKGEKGEAGDDGESPEEMTYQETMEVLNGSS